MTRVRLRVRALWAALTAVLLVIAGGVTVLPAAPAQAASVSISCAPGNVYSVSSKGAVREIQKGKAARTVVDEGSFSSFNGLGIADDGSAVYGYERSNGVSTATIYSLDKANGTWKSTNANTGSKATDYQFVGGAVDLESGFYYFGGFTTDGKSFGIYVYDPKTKSVSRKGVIDTNQNIVGGAVANGDMAFDSNGTLFIVRGMGNATSVFSVTKSNLATASGNNKIPRSYSGPYDTTADVNGVAFDSDGFGYLGSKAQISQWNTPAWKSADAKWFNGVTDFDSTDLASCSAPPTVTLQKFIDGGRSKTGDQFTLSLKEGGVELGPVTTTGNAVNIQEEKIGPIPTKGGAKLTFSEAAGNAATDLKDYAPEYSCTADDKSIGGASGSVTIPDTAKAVVCTITNSPLTANVSIHKDVVDENGENKKPGKDWTVDAKATATSDTVSSTPAATTQKTDANGDAKWGLRFGKTTGRATVAISETQQDGYEFKSANCTITGLDGTKTEKTVTSDKSTDLTGIKPGDDVKCSYLNKVKDTSLTLVKKVDNTAAAGTAKDTDWTLKAVGDAASGNKTIEGKTGSESVTKAKVKTGKYALSEAGTPKGYDASDWVCTPRTGSGVVTSDKSSVTLKSGDDVTCTVTNTAKTGSVTWGKTDESGTALKGSVWTLTGPDGSVITVEDCAAASASECSGSDKDPAAGKFSATGLKWGDYTLREKKAPAGYILDDTPHTCTVSGSDLDKKLGSYTNEQKPPMALPLTGGTGSQIYLIGGAALLAAAGAIALLKGLRRRNRKH